MLPLLLVVASPVEGVNPLSRATVKGGLSHGHAFAIGTTSYSQDVGLSASPKHICLISLILQVDTPCASR